MALYKIIENPGRREVDVDEELGEEQGKLDNQDKAKIVVAALRAKARREKRKVDYVVVTQRERSSNGASSSSSGGTSIRLTEEQRKELAKIVGKHMWETGEQMSMGEALVMVLRENDRLRRKVAKLEGD